MEMLAWPPVFAPTFKIENAGKKNSTYMKAPPHLLDVVDNPTEVEQEIEDAQGAAV
jgi:hypothetical protein